MKEKSKIFDSNIPVISHLTYREWHALFNGFYKGIIAGGREHNYEQEKHYWRGGYLFGSALHYGAAIAVAKRIFKW